MTWVEGVLIGLLTWVITTGITVIFVRAWNPIRWRFTARGEDWYYLERVSGPMAFVPD